jgi:SNF2 family DNA or RNA helicase
MLHDYQKKAIQYILNNPYCGLFLDMGMGKTLSVLKALEVIHFTEGGKTLIIAPLRVAQMTWDQEIKKWGIPLIYSKILGTPKEREKALTKNADIYITNIDNLVWISKHWDFDNIIIDESSLFKSHTTNRFKTLKKLKYSRMVLLSGTPAPNNLTEVWSQMYLLDHGIRLGRNITKFRQQFCYVQQANGHIVYKWGVKDEKAIYDSIKDIVVSMENIKKPEIIYNDIPVYFSDMELKAYEDFENNCYAEIDGGNIDAINAAALINKLTQWTGGHVYDDKHAVKVTNFRKLDALEDLIISANGENILIFANYKHEIASIVDTFGAVHMTKESHFKDWNSGNISIAIVHPRSCGHGLNLQQGGRIIVWYSLTYSLESYLQANARLARQGQSKTVIINRLIVSHTIDWAIAKALDSKNVELKKLLKAVKGGR